MNQLAGEPHQPPAAAPLRVFVADDSRLVHRYLTLSLGNIPGAELAGRAFNSQDASEGVRKVQPDVLILDVEGRTVFSTRKPTSRCCSKRLPNRPRIPPRETRSSRLHGEFFRALLGEDRPLPTDP